MNRTKTVKSALLTALWVVLTTAAMPASAWSEWDAQLAFVQRDRPTITNAADVVLDTAPKQVRAGDDVVFTQRITPAAVRIRHGGFQVRVFALASAEALPSYAHAPIDDCLIFYSAVYQVAPSSDIKIQVITGTGPAWLSTDASRQRVGDGFFLIVFEQVGSPEPVFRLRAADAAAYFATGIRLIVGHEGKVTLRSVLDAMGQREARRAELAADAARNDARTACHRYVRLADGDGGEEAPKTLFAHNCAADPAPRSGSS